MSEWPYPPWSQAKWSERLTMVAIWIVMIPVGIAGFIGFMVLVGMIMEGAAQRSEDHDRCMKRATNGYEIERCR